MHTNSTKRTSEQHMLVGTFCCDYMGTALAVTAVVLGILALTGTVSGTLGSAFLISAGGATLLGTLCSIPFAKQPKEGTAKVVAAAIALIALSAIVLGSLGAAGTLSPQAIAWITVGVGSVALLSSCSTSLFAVYKNEPNNKKK